MDQIALMQSAEQLRLKLDAYAATNDTVAALKRALDPYIIAALSGQIQNPLAWQQIPGGRTFEETNIRECSGLENAYSVFKFAATGGEPAWVQQFKERRGR